MTIEVKSPISALDLRHTRDRWAFAARERTRIDRHWHDLVAANPALWNGQVLMCHSVALAGGLLTGRFFTTDFANFVAWRDWGWPDRTVRNCFGSPVVLSSDGALVYGRMSLRTLNPGGVYPPGGGYQQDSIRVDCNIPAQGGIDPLNAALYQVAPGGVIYVRAGAACN